MVIGRVLDPLGPTRIDVVEAALLVDAHGDIVARAEAGTKTYAELRQHPGAVVLDPRDLLMPGLVDLHIHAPQWPQRGRALDRPLQDWLARYTFPLEARFADTDYAREVYGELVDTLLAQGTTTAVYFATIHEAASLALAEICLARGQRAHVGLVSMDAPGLCPDDYRQPDAQTAIAATRRFIEAVRALPGNGRGLVRPVITPRFVPACSDALLAGLGRLAAETGASIQTHASESDWEHQAVQARCGCTDTAALDGFGLLRAHTVLAHGVFVDAADAGLIRARQAAIAHCPISNTFFAGAVLGLRELLDSDTGCGLGTDISGGFSPSIFDNARQAVLAARLRDSGTDAALSADRRGRAGSALAFGEALWLATGGGGRALGQQGRLVPGAPFDALEISGRGPVLRLERDASEIVQALVCHADAGTIGRVWVQGRMVRGGDARG